ncbi:MAG: alpha/beta fold hydrolase [Chloroflexi bacterium]|nr:alpha/beta fold hydrolase [Chloroflexota bacterium]
MPHAAVNGVELYYEVTGDGYPLVFSHEFAGDYRSWDPQVSFFTRLYRCITYCHRGFPPSSVPDDPAAYSQEAAVEDLRALLDHLGIQQAHIVGLSMGGNVALNLALRHPERCRSIVVAGTGSGTTDRERFEKDLQSSIDLLITRGMRAFADVYTLGAARLPFKRKDPKGWAEFREQFAQHSALGSARTLQGVQIRRPIVFALKEQLNHLRVPTLVLIGDEDEPCVDPAVFLRREIASSGLVVIPQSGHTINLEEPALFNQAVLDFIRMVEAGRWATRAAVTTALLPDAR